MEPSRCSTRSGAAPSTATVARAGEACSEVETPAGLEAAEAESGLTAIDSSLTDQRERAGRGGTGGVDGGVGRRGAGRMDACGWRART